MSFFDQLQPASFRGVPFAVLSAEASFGRRQAVHEYPFRDKPWIEDLGRATRKIAIVGFLVEDAVYGGGDVIAQREAMIAACETKGPGTLVHPTLGRLTVSVPDGGLVPIERWDEGRYFELGFSFIETGDRVFPAAASALAENTSASALQGDIASALDYVNRTKTAIARGSAVIRQAVSTATGWAGQIERLAGDATGLFSMIASLPGNFGRFFPGGTKGYSGTLIVPGAPTTVSGLIDAGSAARAAITEADAAMVAAAGTTDANNVASAAQAAAAALLAAIIDPGVATPLLSSLANYFPDDPTTDSVIGEAMATVQAAYAAMARRAALAALVRNSALYQPTSRDDAAALRDHIAALLDAEILIAGDDGDDNSYSALRAMRVAMVTDLNSRGASLPPMKRFTFNGNLPALTLAQRLYQDAARGDELIIEANPPHPAFMPTSFSALAS